MFATNAGMQKATRLRGDAGQSARIVTVDSVGQLRNLMTPGSGLTAPFRPQGANSSSTDCNATAIGTILDMTSMDGILDVDPDRFRITVQAGARIGQVVDTLARHGMELAGSHDQLQRTVGGAVAGGSIGPAVGATGSLFAAQAIGLKVVTPDGNLLVADSRQQKILGVLRQSYGMLGTIVEVTLKTRPITAFRATHRRCTIEQFSKAVETLARTRVGLRFVMLPFADEVHLDLRRPDAAARATVSLPWKFRDWSETRFVPAAARSLRYLLPVARLRHPLVDRLSSATLGLAGNRFASAGSAATANTGAGKTGTQRYSTWLFPAGDFTVAVQAYREFCAQVREQSGFRCDLPTIGYLVGRDASAILSPSFDEPMIALRALTTGGRGWSDFAIDFGDFARNWGATPMFDQSLELDPSYARSALGQRLEYFRRVRRQVDPENRMMNPFLSQYFL